MGVRVFAVRVCPRECTCAHVFITQQHDSRRHNYRYRYLHAIFSVREVMAFCKRVDNLINTSEVPINSRKCRQGRRNITR